MKTKIVLLFLFFFLSMKICAQFSFSNMTSVIEKKKEKKDEKSDSADNGRDIQAVIVVFKRKINWFPAKFDTKGSELSTIFFEGKKDYTQLFQNNNVVYNPNLKNLSFNSEVVNDYMGPVRVGIGFQFNSTVEDDDSLKAVSAKKDQLISSLQNGGGNLFFNVKYPIIALGGSNSSFGLKAYLYHNTGIELTKLNGFDNDFVMTNNTGITVGGFGTGKKKLISAFFEVRGALLYGNSKYNSILSVEKNFKHILPLLNVGVGINFMDMYTVKAEFYPAGSYIKNNFPATISFVIVPKANEKK